MYGASRDHRSSPAKGDAAQSVQAARARKWLIPAICVKRSENPYVVSNNQSLRRSLLKAIKALWHFAAVGIDEGDRARGVGDSTIEGAPGLQVAAHLNRVGVPRRPQAAKK